MDIFFTDVFILFTDWETGLQNYFTGSISNSKVAFSVEGAGLKRGLAWGLLIILKI
ncbi:hypothetical protein [Syntrophomonas palmitatica]|uniref:hypothetical protein n=1 Tax=Syntrophomonas palmitatica TaxID=402877 RepID=UPI000AB669D3|nr:hypothetical protein [Syntrophomonas palmitatica]